MVSDRYDFNTGRMTLYSVDDLGIHTFMRWIMASSKWMDDPELVLAKLTKLRKEIILKSEPAVPVVVGPVEKPAKKAIVADA